MFVFRFGCRLSWTEAAIPKQELLCLKETTFEFNFIVSLLSTTVQKAEALKKMHKIKFAQLKALKCNEEK